MNQDHTYEIYALKYAGPLTSSGAFLMWMKDWDKSAQRNGYLWCIKGQQLTVVVDAGVSPGLARDRNMAGYENPADVLSRIQVKADDVEHVVLTHAHWDHADGLSLFPNATIYIQEAEYRFWLQDDIAARPPFGFYFHENVRTNLLAAENAGRLKRLDGDSQIFPNIECLLAPGHSIALQALAVKSASGTAILGSDCAHIFQNYAEDWPSALIVDLAAWMRSFDKLRERVASPELLFPGHDPLMTDNYPKIADGVTRLV